MTLTLEPLVVHGPGGTPVDGLGGVVDGLGGTLVLLFDFFNPRISNYPAYRINSTMIIQNMKVLGSSTISSQAMITSAPSASVLLPTHELVGIS